jgi:hypothetical protein
MDMPIAEMSGARRGASRKGRYAIFSIVAPYAAQIAPAAITVMRMESGSDIAVTPVAVRKPSRMMPRYAPSIYISPCAKLISSSMPYTIVYPSAIRAYTAPTVRPLIICWSSSSISGIYSFFAGISQLIIAESLPCLKGNDLNHI